MEDTPTAVRPAAWAEGWRLRFLAGGVAAVWIAYHLGWLPAHIFNATRFILYDQGSYLYAVQQAQRGEALYRDFAWQYGPLALAYYRAFAALAGNSPVTLVVASSLAFAGAWVMLAELAVRNVGWKWGAVLAALGLLPVMSASGLMAINGPHGAVEMLLLAAGAWTIGNTKPDARRAWALGIGAGLLQWVRFGPHAVAFLAALTVTAWELRFVQRQPGPWARAVAAFAGRMAAGYVVTVAPLAGWYGIALPRAGAWEQWWPVHMVEHYAATYPNRWPALPAWREFLMTWFPALVGLGLATSGLLHAVRRGEQGVAPERRAIEAALMFLPVCFVFSCALTLRNDYSFVGQMWMCWPGLALLAWMRMRLVTLGLLALLVPAAVHVGRELARQWQEERAWAAEPLRLPNGQQLWFRPREAGAFGELEKALGPVPGRKLAVMLGGGGVHYFFRTQRVGRQWWFLPAFVRPWEETAVARDLLAHELVLVVDMGQESAGQPRQVLNLWIPLPPEMSTMLVGRLEAPVSIRGVGDLMRIRP